MLLVQYGYIFLVLIFLLLFSSPEGSDLSLVTYDIGFRFVLKDFCLNKM